MTSSWKPSTYHQNEEHLALLNPKQHNTNYPTSLKDRAAWQINRILFHCRKSFWDSLFMFCQTLPLLLLLAYSLHLCGMDPHWTIFTSAIIIGVCNLLFVALSFIRYNVSNHNQQQQQQQWFMLNFNMIPLILFSTKVLVNSSYYNLRYTEMLLFFILANAFVLLSTIIRNMIWRNNETTKTFFPRSFRTALAIGQGLFLINEASNCLTYFLGDQRPDVKNLRGFYMTNLAAFCLYAVGVVIFVVVFLIFKEQFLSSPTKIFHQQQDEDEQEIQLSRTLQQHRQKNSASLRWFQLTPLIVISVVLIYTFVAQGTTSKRNFNHSPFASLLPTLGWPRGYRQDHKFRLVYDIPEAWVDRFGLQRWSQNLSGVLADLFLIICIAIIIAATNANNAEFFSYLHLLETDRSDAWESRQKEKANQTYWKSKQQPLPTVHEQPESCGGIDIDDTSINVHTTPFEDDEYDVDMDNDDQKDDDTNTNGIVDPSGRWIRRDDNGWLPNTKKTQEKIDNTATSLDNLNTNHQNTTTTTTTTTTTNNNNNNGTIDQSKIQDIASRINQDSITQTLHENHYSAPHRKKNNNENKMQKQYMNQYSNHYSVFVTFYTVAWNTVLSCFGLYQISPTPVIQTLLTQRGIHLGAMMTIIATLYIIFGLTLSYLFLNMMTLLITSILLTFYGLQIVYIAAHQGWFLFQLDAKNNAFNHTKPSRSGTFSHISVAESDTDDDNVPGGMVIEDLATNSAAISPRWGLTMMIFIIITVCTMLGYFPTAVAIFITSTIIRKLLSFIIHKCDDKPTSTFVNNNLNNNKNNEYDPIPAVDYSNIPHDSFRQPGVY